MTEEERQREIDNLSLQFQAAKTIARRTILWDRIKELIKGRSKETVEKMERERGLK